MVAAVAFPLLVLASDSRQLGDIAIPFYMFVSAVVGAYIGFAAWDDKNIMSMRQGRRGSTGYKDWRNDFDDQDYRDSRWR